MMVDTMIENNEEYERKLKRLEKLIDLDPEIYTLEGMELNTLVDDIEQYEDIIVKENFLKMKRDL